jgi:diguanylate cyclase (GGDEF)-like protein
MKKLESEETERIRQILGEMKALEGRDLQLWSIAVLVLLVLGGGLVAVLLPERHEVSLDPQVLQALLYGLVSLIVLYNIYLLLQKRTLRFARADLVRQLLRADSAEKLAMRDPLTGLFNRRYLDHALLTEAKRSSRTRQPLSTLMLDLDDFGAMNKRYGHLQGDRLLIEFAQLLQSVFRQTDTVTRYGGDEFIVVLTDTSHEEAEKARRRLLAAVERWNEGKDPEHLRIAVSIGIAEYQEEQGVEGLLRQTDEYLRREKNSIEVAADPQ